MFQWILILFAASSFAQLYLAEFEDTACTKPYRLGMIPSKCLNGKTSLSCSDATGVGTFVSCMNCKNDSSSLCSVVQKVEVNKCRSDTNTVYSCSPKEVPSKGVIQYSAWMDSSCTATNYPSASYNQTKNDCVNGRETFRCVLGKGVEHTLYVPDTKCTKVEANKIVPFGSCYMASQDYPRSYVFTGCTASSDVPTLRVSSVTYLLITLLIWVVCQ